MHYKTTITIDLPRTKVLELFNTPENLMKWQKGLVSYEQVSGTPGQPGAVSKLTFKNGMELMETITVVNLPDEFSGIYEMKGVWNEVKNFFREQDAARTDWTLDCTFRMDSPFMKLMAFLMPGMFRAQTKSLMNAFKEFAEKGTNVNA